MYEATYSLESVGKFNTFEEAFAAIYKKLNIDIENGGISYQFLETTIWIEDLEMRPSPMFFYDARDLACNIGLLKNGKLQEDVLETAKKYAKKISEQSKETD